jgi:hypothetical protein
MVATAENGSIEIPTSQTGQTNTHDKKLELIVDDKALEAEIVRLKVSIGGNFEQVSPNSLPNLSQRHSLPGFTSARTHRK